MKNYVVLTALALILSAPCVAQAATGYGHGVQVAQNDTSSTDANHGQMHREKEQHRHDMRQDRKQHRHDVRQDKKQKRHDARRDRRQHRHDAHRDHQQHAQDNTPPNQE